MKYKNKISLYLSFVKPFYAASLLLTSVCVWLGLKFGMSIFGVLFYFKVFSMSLVFYVADVYSSRKYYYYYNLGFSKRGLWLPVVITDVAIFLIVVLLSIYITK